MCRIATGHWQTVRDGLTECLCIVDCLVQGETYSFRVLSHAPGTIPGFVFQLPLLIPDDMVLITVRDRFVSFDQ